MKTAKQVQQEIQKELEELMREQEEIKKRKYYIDNQEVTEEKLTEELAKMKMHPSQLAIILHEYQIDRVEVTNGKTGTTYAITRN